jgi:N-acetylneuraminic acid mutarotase
MVEYRHPEEESLENKAWCWSSVSAQGKVPCARSLHTGVGFDNSLYVFGGYDGAQRVNDFYRFNFETYKWSVVVTESLPPSPRDRHISVVYGRSIYIYGGYDGYNRVNDFYEYDVDRNTWKEVISSGPPPSARHSHSSVVYKECMYIFAGYDGLYRNDFYKYDFTTNSWESITDGLGTPELWPKPRYRTSACVVGDRMIIFGGHDGARQLNDFYSWDFESRTWQCIETLGTQSPVPRDSHVSVAYRDSLFIFGGSTGNAKSDFWEFKFEESKWHAVTAIGGSSPCSRFCHIGAVVSKCFYVFGGYDGSQRLNDFKQFRFEPECAEVPKGSLQQDLRSFVNDPRFSDVSLLAEGQRIYAHKLFLCRSTYFKAMLLSDMRESCEEEIQLPSVSHKVMLEVLRYLYTDYIDVHLDMAMDLFEAADLFCIDRLKLMCEQTIHNSIDIDNAANIFQAADAHEAKTLRDSALRFIVSNFDQVSKSQAFQEMARSNVDLVIEILDKR